MCGSRGAGATLGKARLRSKGICQNAKYLNKLIQDIGTRSEKRIIKTFFEQFPEIENIFSSQSNVKEKKDYTSFFENYQNYLLVLLVIFLITFIVTIVSV